MSKKGNVSKTIKLDFKELDESGSKSIYIPVPGYDPACDKRGKDIKLNEPEERWYWIAKSNVIYKGTSNDNHHKWWRSNGSNKVHSVLGSSWWSSHYVLAAGRYEFEPPKFGPNGEPSRGITLS